MWVFGIVLILFLLPFDIIFPAKTASMLRMGFAFGMVILLTLLLASGMEMDELIEKLAKCFRFLYSYAPVCILVFVVLSIGITTKVRQKRGYKI